MTRVGGGHGKEEGGQANRAGGALSMAASMVPHKAFLETRPSLPGAELEQKEPLGVSPNPDSTIAAYKTPVEAPASLEPASACGDCVQVSTGPAVCYLRGRGSGALCGW